MKLKPAIPWGTLTPCSRNQEYYYFRISLVNWRGRCTTYRIGEVDVLPTECVQILNSLFILTELFNLKLVIQDLNRTVVGSLMTSSNSLNLVPGYPAYSGIFYNKLA